MMMSLLFRDFTYFVLVEEDFGAPFPSGTASGLPKGAGRTSGVNCGWLTVHNALLRGITLQQSVTAAGMLFGPPVLQP